MKRKMMSMFCVMILLLLAAGCGKSNETASTAHMQTGNAAGSSKTESGANNTANSRISEEEARSIALKDAGVSEQDISGIRIKLEKDDGIQQYEVDFYAGDREYDYDIDASTGKILSKDMEIDDDFRRSDASQPADLALSEEDAIKMALEKVPQAAKENVRIHLDYDDGKAIYEGSIIYDGVEYDFEIDASTGVLLEWEQER